ncbi:MAG: ComEA family DNA-binding protein [Atopobiaceae bacterium]|nr:ComEA family DNA-binding protein [Atopobiaceae bacterium]
MAQLARQVQDKLRRNFGIGVTGRVGRVALLSLMLLFGLGLSIVLVRGGFSPQSQAILPTNEISGHELVGKNDGVVSTNGSTDSDEVEGLSESSTQKSSHSSSDESDTGLQAKQSKSEASQTSSDSEALQRLAVHVDGAVHKPGLYWIEKSDVRVMDAIEAAGGLSDDANTQAINLAAPVSDGSKIYVAHADEELAQGTVPEPVSEAVPSPHASNASEQQPSFVDINHADSTTLQTLPGIGPSTAQAIIEDRQNNGPFNSIEDIMRVSGIGEKKFDRIQGLICVS